MRVVVAEGGVVKPRFIIRVLPLKAQRLVDLVNTVKVYLSPRFVISLPDNLACAVRHLFRRTQRVGMKIIDLRAIQIIPGGIDASEGSVTALFVAVEPRERRLLGLMLSVAEQAQSLPQEASTVDVRRGCERVMLSDHLTDTAAQRVVVVMGITDLLVVAIHLCANQAIVTVILKVLHFILRGELERIAPRIIGITVAFYVALAIIANGHMTWATVVAGQDAVRCLIIAEPLFAQRSGPIAL